MDYNIRRLCYKKAIEISYKIDRPKYLYDAYRPSNGYLILQEPSHLDEDYIMEEIFGDWTGKSKYYDFKMKDIVVRVIEDGVLKNEIIDSIKSGSIINKDTLDAIDYKGNSYCYRISYDLSKDEYNIILDNSKDSDITEVDEEFYHKAYDFMKQDNIWDKILEHEDKSKKKNSKFKLFSLSYLKDIFNNKS